MNQASHMLGIQSLAFFHKKLLFFRKNLKIDNFLFSIKHKTTQNKELKYRRKNIVCSRPLRVKRWFIKYVHILNVEILYFFIES